MSPSRPFLDCRVRSLVAYCNQQCSMPGSSGWPPYGGMALVCCPAQSFVPFTAAHDCRQVGQKMLYVLGVLLRQRRRQGRIALHPHSDVSHQVPALLEQVSHCFFSILFRLKQPSFRGGGGLPCRRSQDAIFSL